MRKSRVLELAVLALLSAAWLQSLQRNGRQTATGLQQLLSQTSLSSRRHNQVIDAAGGRDARKPPTAIPARGWYVALRNIAQQFIEHRLMYEAAGMIFFVLLAIFPAITALVSFYGLFIDPKVVADHAARLSRLMPGGTMDILKDQIVRASATDARQFGFGLFLGLAISLWSANRGMKALFHVLNVAYGETERRHYIRLTLVTLGFTLAALVLIIAVISVILLLPSILRPTDPAAATDPLLRPLCWPIFLVVAIPCLSTVYRYGPSRRRERWRWVTWGGVSAAVVWMLVSLAFSSYVNTFGAYDRTYGSMAAAVGFMTWIWVSVMVVLLGAELNAELERQAAVRGDP